MKKPIQSGGEALPETTSSAPANSQTETRTVGDAIDILVRALSVNRVLWLAMPTYDGNDAERDGMMFVVDHVDDLLKDAKSILYANLQQGGAA